MKFSNNLETKKRQKRNKDHMAPIKSKWQDDLFNYNNSNKYSHRKWSE